MHFIHLFSVLSLVHCTHFTPLPDEICSRFKNEIIAKLSEC